MGALDLAEAQRETHRWLQSLLEIQSESRDSKEFLENIKGDLFPDEVYVFTPKGKIMALPRGATAVDFGAGTSSRSSKLIHGGVRYLQQGDIGLVREAASERTRIRRIAPHLAAPLLMVMPTYGRAMHMKLAAGL